MKDFEIGATGPATPVRANKLLRAANIRRLMAHAADVVLFEGGDSVTETTEEVALNELDKHQSALNVPYLDLHDVDDKVLALVRPAGGDDPAPSGTMDGPDGPPHAIYMLAEPIPLPDGWLDAIPVDAEIEWTDGEVLFELVDGVVVRAGPDASDACQPPSGGSEAAPTLNQATFRGAETAGFGEAINREVEVLLGAMYSAGSKRNTQDGDWMPFKARLSDLIHGYDASGDAPEFGFSRHPVSKKKEGRCIVMGSSIDGARKAKAMKWMHFIGLDIDSGAALETVVAKIEQLGLFALVHTSYNHGKSGLRLKRDEVLKKLHIKTDPTVDQIQQYLREFDKNRYEEAFIQQIAIKHAKKQVKDGVVIELDTPPLHKFRLFFPLKDPVEIVALGDTHEEALTDWESAVTGLAHSVLGVHFDATCTDPSRLFFTPRHPKGAEYASYIVMGDPLDYASIPRVKKSVYAKNRDLNSFLLADDTEGPEKIEQIWLPSGADLNRWHSKTGKSRLMLADLLETYCPDKIRVAGGEKSGAVHTECPFEHEHTNEGGTATMAINCLDNENGYWTWFCKHDACEHRHKTAFLGEAINRGWFDEELLDSDEFLLPPDDDEIDEDEAEAQAEAMSNPAAEPKGPKTVEELIARIDFKGDGVEAAIRKLYKRLHRREIDKVEQTRVNRLIKDETGLDLNTLKSFWRDLDRAKFDKEQEETNRTAPIVTEADFDVMVDYAENRIATANEEEARLFHYMDRLAEVRDDQNGDAKITLLDRDGFAAFLNRVSRYQAKITDKKSRHVAAPESVVRHVFARPPRRIVPPLRGVVTSPTFSDRGHIITVPGYHQPSSLYYAPPPDFTLPAVSLRPSDEDVHEAKRLLIEEVFADFPLGGRTRDEIVEECLDGEGIPAVAHLIAFTLLPFCREMIDGPTPGHAVVKPSPGTGASLLTEVASIISTGVVTSSMAMPGKKDEMGKTLTSVLENGQNIVFFDNIDKEVDSAELASALTAKFYAARILGKSQTVNTEVRCAWIFTGNNALFSGELVRRLILIDLDAKVQRPELRSGFRHANLRGWVEKNRGLLVWACLTLIQHWVAKGMPDSGEAVQASYENWSRVIGGILNEAGIGGFLGNRDMLRAQASNDDGGPDVQLMLHLANGYDNGQHFRVTGSGDFGKDDNGKVIKTEALLTILNDHNMKDGVEPIVLDSTDYTHDRDTGFFSYANPPKFKKAIKRLVGKTYNFEVDDQEMTAVLRHKFDSRNRTDVFVLEKEPVKKVAA